MCGLTDDQQKKIAELVTAREKEMRAIYVKYQTDIMAVLSDDQKALWNTSFLMSMTQRFLTRANLTDEQWQWVMDFVERGGPTLTAYPRFARIHRDETGRWVIASDQLAGMHRMSIGTITADGSVNVQFVGGKKLGAVEESFVARLKPGDVFTFAGRNLEFVRVHDMTAHVRTAKKKRGNVPRWMGGRLPMSASLAEAVRLRLEEASDGIFIDDEMRIIR